MTRARTLALGLAAAGPDYIDGGPGEGRKGGVGRDSLDGGPGIDECFVDLADSARNCERSVHSYDDSNY